MSELNETHDAGRKSWIASANHPDSDFPLQNLPFGVFSRPGEKRRGGVAIGESILDLGEALSAGLIPAPARAAAQAAAGPTLNPLLAAGSGPASVLRAALFSMLEASGESIKRVQLLADRILVPAAEATLHAPVAVGAYTDFCCSLDHVARMTKGAVPPAFFHLPIGYNGRASSVTVSGAPVRRPAGQYKAPDGAVRWGPEPMLDFELELAAYVCGANDLGAPVGIEDAGSRLFGYCLLNDWSARGIQFFESILGPFLGKSFQTTISPWIVTAEALAPFRIGARGRHSQEPNPPAHLLGTMDQREGGLDIDLTAGIRIESESGQDRAAEQLIARTAFREMYWTFAQMFAHHTSNGCNLGVGDLLASGTVSGSETGTMGCLAEITGMGTSALTLQNGQTRQWLQDGDEVILRGRASRKGFASLGFGACSGKIHRA